jgi:hypothetical protein
MVRILEHSGIEVKKIRTDTPLSCSVSKNKEYPKRKGGVGRQVD